MADENRLFFKLHSGFSEHPKTVGLSDKAFRHLIELWLYCHRNMTDGNVPKGQISRALTTKTRRELIEAEFLIEGPESFEMHDYLRHQMSANDVENLKNKRKMAGSKGGKAKANGLASATASALANSKQSPSKPVADIDIDKDTKDSSSEVATATTRPEVESLLDLLDKCIESNGLKTPSRNKGNTNSMRLLIDRDGYTPDQVAWIIRWATADSFWRTNILSAVKLRDKFTQLMAKADVGQAPKAKAAGFNGEINVDAVLGKDYWQPPLPPEGMGVAEEIEWKKQRRADRKAERLEEARRKVETDNAAQI